jgi:serine/threonine protein kinase
VPFNEETRMPLATGQVLQNRYRIVSLLGQGGMGTVYRAWDTRLDMAMALKEMTPQPGLDPHTLNQLVSSSGKRQPC